MFRSGNKCLLSCCLLILPLLCGCASSYFYFDEAKGPIRLDQSRISVERAKGMVGGIVPVWIIIDGESAAQNAIISKFFIKTKDDYVILGDHFMTAYRKRFTVHQKNGMKIDNLDTFLKNHSVEEVWEILDYESGADGAKRGTVLGKLGPGGSLHYDTASGMLTLRAIFPGATVGKAHLSQDFEPGKQYIFSCSPGTGGKLDFKLKEAR